MGGVQFQGNGCQGSQGAAGETPAARHPLIVVCLALAV